MLPALHARMLAFLVLSCVTAKSVVEGKLIGAAVMPHGDFAYDPTLFERYADYSPNATQQSRRLFDGSRRVGRWLASLKPDTIVLTTPHGLETDWSLAIYSNSELKGEATVGRDLDESYAGGPHPTYTVESRAKGDLVVAKALSVALSEAHGANSTSVIGWNDVIPLPLHWGEALPLRLMPDGDTAQLVVVGLPLSRHNYSSRVAPGFVEMGKVMGEVLESSPKRIALLVSTDLAHRHWPNTTMGFSPHSEPFDRAVGQWAASLDRDSLLVESTRWVDEVYSCGWLGICLLQGALDQVGTWLPRLEAGPEHPTYYGMLAASFARVQSAAHR